MPPSTQERPPTFEVLADETSLWFDQYRHLSPEERRRRNELYWQRLSDPEHRAFLAGLFRMSLNMTDGVTGEDEFAGHLEQMSR